MIQYEVQTRNQFKTNNEIIARFADDITTSEYDNQTIYFSKSLDKYFSFKEDILLVLMVGAALSERKQKFLLKALPGLSVFWFCLRRLILRPREACAIGTISRIRRNGATVLK